MKHTVLLLAAFTCWATNISARQLTPAASLERFRLAEHAAARANGASTAKLKLSHTSKVGDEATFYVFSATNEDGFIILAADDLAPELLGYVPHGSFDANSLPPGFKYWTEELDRQIALAIKSNTPLYSSTQQVAVAHHAPQRITIPPLVTSQWGQSHPYNDECPVIDGQHCYTGCVATAMAQIMYTHKYPAEKFSWSTMLDKYSSHSSAAANAAVAQLMHACGQAVNMSYGLEASGAESEQVMPALFKTFNYDGSGRYCPRYMYDDNEWTDLLYTELAAGRPIYYSGATSTSGHAFVLDGYDNGMFHINWGWDGMCDGYYNVTGIDPLHPKEQGAGGSIVDEGFTAQQVCITGIQSPKGDNSAPFCIVNTTKHYQVCGFNGAQATDFTVGAPGTIVSTGKFINLTNTVTDVYLGVKFVNQLNNLVYYTCDSDAHLYNLNIEAGTAEYPFTTAGIPKGIYYVYPVARATPSDKWTEVELRPDTKVPYINIGNYTPQDLVAELACTAMRLNLDDCSGRTVSVTLEDVYNVAYDQVNFFGDVALCICDDDEQTIEVLNGCWTLPITTPLLFECRYPQPITISTDIPASIPDGHYLLIPVALHKYSSEWIYMGTYFNNGDYDIGIYQNVELIVEGGNVRLRDAHGNDTDDYHAGLQPVRLSSEEEAYTLDGRPAAQGQHGLKIVRKGKTYTKSLGL